MCKQHHRAQALIRLRCELHSMVLLAAVLFPAAASAEICDKAVGDAWRAEHGPVWLLNPVGFPVGLTFLVGALIVLALARVQWLQWLGYAMSVFVVLGNLAVIFGDLIPQHDIYLAQVREGCRSYRTDIMNVALTLPLAGIYAWLGYRVRRRTAVEIPAGT